MVADTPVIVVNAPLKVMLTFCVGATPPGCTLKLTGFGLATNPEAPLPLPNVNPALNGYNYNYQIQEILKDPKRSQQHEPGWDPQWLDEVGVCLGESRHLYRISRIDAATSAGRIARIESAIRSPRLYVVSAHATRKTCSDPP